ncbi:MAG: hypothetical protein JXA09_03400 [Anaerolineae bacterium]|nr:hypothetical protein [Anaerolineae bacterium]
MTGYALTVALIAWLAWLVVVVQLPVNPFTVVLFYAALFVAVGATLMPAVAYLNVRFGRFESRRVFQLRFLRQSILGGLFVVILTWMQMGRMLTTMLALILLSVFVLTETFLITREMPKER